VTLQLRPRVRALLPRTLTARLVVTAVALVAVVGILVAASATFAMRSYLTDQLDSKVRSALERTSHQLQGVPDDGPDNNIGGPSGQVPDTLTAVVPAASSIAPAGVILNESLGKTQLATTALTPLGQVPADREGHTVKITGRGYRVMVEKDSAGNALVVGLPTSEIDRTLSSMLRWFALLTLLGVGIAGFAGTLLVRRQMRPLYAVAETAREVSTQELSSGDTAIETRVPDDLTDEQSEVGQVGAALNTLLDHIDDALSARHRSEQQVRQFVADASHVLRTPLATIAGYCELAR
jgi:two-component system OmpR family sensor kinase